MTVQGAEPSRLYDPDPHHLWNRLHETLFIRVGPDGRPYGEDRLDPLVWSSTRHLLEGDSHRRALRVLDEFLSRHGERLIRDPLERAFLQHDLWVLFDWSTGGSRSGVEQYRRATTELQSRLAVVIRRLALTAPEIASLPDNYRRAQAGNLLASLPPGLLQPAGDWVKVGLDDGTAVAPVHMADFGGRSVFEVWARLPGGRAATVSYLQALRSFERPRVDTDAASGSTEGSVARDPRVSDPAVPQFPLGTTWALVRRMCVLDTEARIHATSVVESVQVRRYNLVPTSATVPNDESRGAQSPFEFAASRERHGDLREVLDGERGFPFVQFRSLGIDPFEYYEEHPVAAEEARDFAAKVESDVLGSCGRCHTGAGIRSVNSNPLSSSFAPRRLQLPQLIESDDDREAQATASWKRQQYDFGLLQGLWAGLP